MTAGGTLPSPSQSRAEPTSTVRQRLGVLRRRMLTPFPTTVPHLSPPRYQATAKRAFRDETRILSGRQARGIPGKVIARVIAARSARVG